MVLADSEKMEHSWLGPGVGQYILKVTPTLNLIALCPRGHQNDNDTHIYRLYLYELKLSAKL